MEKQGYSMPASPKVWNSQCGLKAALVRGTYKLPAEQVEPSCELKVTKTEKGLNGRPVDERWILWQVADRESPELRINPEDPGKWGEQVKDAETRYTLVQR
jgi:hypothetical protein